jgi:hypothetical protein
MSPYSGVDQDQARVRQSTGGHMARLRSRWAAAGWTDIGVADDFSSRPRAWIIAATTLSVAVHGSGDHRYDGIGQKQCHQRQAEKLRQDRWALMNPDEAHDRDHKISTTLCQLKKRRLITAVFWSIYR